jgi:hypothetical protein
MNINNGEELEQDVSEEQIIHAKREKGLSKVRSKSPQNPCHTFIEFKKQLARPDILQGRTLPFDS